MDSAGFATAYGLSTSVGLRPFLVLAVASLAMSLGYVHPSHAFAYLGSSGATWLLAGLAILEFAGDKLPVVDNALHAIHFATKPIAAALLVGSIVPGGGLDGTSIDAATYATMGVAALNALGVHTGVTALRGASTTMTLGLANPLVSLAEDVLALGATTLAFALPYVGAVVALVITIVLLFVARSVIRAVRGRSRATSLRTVAATPREGEGLRR